VVLGAQYALRATPSGIWSVEWRSAGLLSQCGYVFGVLGGWGGVVGWGGRGYIAWSALYV